MRKGEFKIPLCKPVVQNFSSYPPWSLISYWEKSQLDSCQISAISSPAKITIGFNTLTSKKTPPQIFHRTTDVPPIRDDFNVNW